MLFYDFFMVMPALLGGFGNILVPVMIGCRHGILKIKQYHLALPVSMMLLISSALVETGAERVDHLPRFEGPGAKLLFCNL
jgi:heme/copper-type cytochrome/quinol oxidase subunit 1